MAVAMLVTRTLGLAARAATLPRTETLAAAHAASSTRYATTAAR
jgi:hypothetical protein